MSTYPLVERELARQTIQKVAAEADAYMARWLLQDFIDALRVENPADRQLALTRVKLEVQAFLDSGGRESGEAPRPPAQT